MAEVGPRHPLKTEIILHKEDGRDLCKIKNLPSDEIAGNSISFTTNCWSGSNEALIGLTAHFIENNCVYKRERDPQF